MLLVSANIGEGIFFAGSNHVALRVVASPDEHRVISSDPREILRQRQQSAADSIDEISPPTPPQAVKSKPGQVVRPERTMSGAGAHHQNQLGGASDTANINSAEQSQSHDQDQLAQDQDEGSKGPAQTKILDSDGPSSGGQVKPKTFAGYSIDDYSPPQN